MYAYERLMVIYRGYVRNCANPEGSMIEGYTTEEVIECYAYYIRDGKPISVPVSWHHGRLSGKGTKGRKIIRDNSYQTIKEEHYSFMHRLIIMRPYVEKYLQELNEKNADRGEEWIMKEHKI